MRKIITRIFSFASALAVAAAMNAAAAADNFTFSFDDKTLVDEIVADTYDINGSEITLEKELGDADSDAGLSVRCVLFNDYIDPEFWSNPDVKVSIDVKLETEGADVIGYIVGFDSKWTLINPSEFTTLRSGEWITLTETGEHFYEYFKDSTPGLLLFQARSNWGADPQGDVKITVRNFTISDGTETVVIDPTEDAADESSDSGNDSTSAPDGGTASDGGNDADDNISDTPSPSESTVIQTAATEGTQPDYVEMDINSEATKSTAMLFIIFIVGVAVVVAAIVVGYLIYKKKRYY